MAPAYEAAAKELVGKVQFGQVEVTTNHALAARFLVTAYPSLYLYVAIKLNKKNEY